jgi:PBP1b-binding outer membrane lipoprotein LpoB
MNMNKKIIYIFMTSPLFLGGCVNVEPWERENLAKADMQLVPNALHNAFMTHVNFSREGTQGGYGLEGGGCGCN